MEFSVIKINIDEVLVQAKGDYVGEVTLKDDLSGQIHVHTIWYSNDGEHYFCYPTGEYNDDNDEELETYLISDYLQPKECE